jgi:hypothetical protein
MINFLNSLPQSERKYYHNISHILGVSESLNLKGRENEKLNNEDMF